ncbi:MAG: ABC-F family ATP-binding cassette domain-containing protein [Balneolales bacterium]
MTYLSTDNLSKNYGIKTLFEGITFGLSKGDKTALIAQNGTGKSTLLNILAGNEKPDIGEVMTRNGIRLGYLEQEPRLDETMSISTFISQGSSDAVRIVQAYEKAVHEQAEDFNPETQKAFDEACAAMDAAGAWDHEQRMEQILGKLDIHDLSQSIKSLSGGERKRVALAFVLLDSPDLIILDEPTNHLDVDMIEWLEDYLMKANITLLMVTHDRYFLDRVCTHILELEGGKLYHHKGNYSYFLQKRAEREEVENIEYGKAGQLMKKELEWMRRSPKARTTKSKSRISAFHATKEKATSRKSTLDLKLEVNMTRMGGQVLELKGVNKSYGGLTILKDFDYSFNKGERIGIIGKNGAGKSTLLNIITGEIPADSGEIKTGGTIVYGHYRQQGLQVDEGKRVIDVLKDIAEVIELANGNRITASQFLEHFMFTPAMQYTPVSKLSGGEKRRLGLMMVLIKNPNFLILDEPTNDLDLVTLNKLEDFLLDFGGCLLVVSHDRFFMDKLVEHYFVFEGNGTIKDFNGTYREYRKEAEQEVVERRKEERTVINKPATVNTEPKQSGKKALNYAERKEYQKLEKEIAGLEEEKRRLEIQIEKGSGGYDNLEQNSVRYGEIIELTDEKTMRWIELADKA